MTEEEKRNKAIIALGDELDEIQFRLKCRDDELAELQHLYNELNDFSNSQLKKVLEENEKLKWEQKQILEDNENYQKENEELKQEIESLKGFREIQEKIWAMFGSFAELKELYQDIHGVE